MRKTSALACVAFSALTILGNVPTVRAATPIQCGDVITGNVVLTEDRTCSGDALRVAGPGEVNIDLNGHRLRGDGTGNGIGIEPFAPGFQWPSRITVTGGRIEGFSAGVRPTWIPTRIHEVTLADNTRGMTTDAQYTEVEVSESTFLRNDLGLARYSGQTTITGSSFRDNGVGINCRDGNLWVVDSRFSDNQRGIDSSLCRVNVATSDFVGGKIGLALQRSEFRMDIRNNTFKGAGIGVHVTRAGGFQGFRVIADNAFVDNGASGLVIDNDPRASGQGFEVSGNVFKGNGYLPGSHVDPTGSPLTSGVWSDAGSMFAGNTAIGNAGHGIEAYGATDGGGNIARGNAAQPQCIGVVCARAR